MIPGPAASRPRRAWRRTGFNLALVVIPGVPNVILLLLIGGFLFYMVRRGRT
jgi:hypothetical protein